MKRLIFSALLVLSGGLFAACGGESHAPPAPSGTFGNGSGGKGGNRGFVVGTLDGGVTDGGDTTPGSGGTGGAGGDAGARIRALAPVVTITDPPAASDPSVGPVLMGSVNTVTVTCNVVQSTAHGSKPVDPSSVTIEMLDANGKSLTTPPQPAKQSQSQPDDFTGQFTYTNVPNGKVSFRCNAKDTSGLAGSATLDTFVDHGPTISLALPMANQAVSLASLDVEFSVTAWQLADGDDQAAVDKVTLTVYGRTIQLGAPDSKGNYKVSVNLADANLFPNKPNGATALLISATNKRGTTNVLNSTILVDSQGPIITITDPPPAAIIGGKQVVSFTITDDAAGVDPKYVILTVNQDPSQQYTMDNGLWTDDNGKFTFALDTTNITGGTVQINLSITAKDNVLNPSPGASIIYYLDTTPPRVDLDPPDIQELRPDGATWVCSAGFDPVGKNTVNDWTKDETPISNFIQVRAICYDEGNSTDDEPRQYYSGISSKALPTLYIQGDANAGLLVDTGTDGVCDDVNTKLPTFVVMHPVQPAGASFYPPVDGLRLPGSDPGTFLCHAGTDTAPPQKVCAGVDLTRVIDHEHTGSGTSPVIYGTDNATDACGVNQVQLSSFQGVKNGWVCLAVRAVDGTGNVGISPPVRVCLNNPSGPTPDCAKNVSIQPPSCTDGCTPPEHFYQHSKDTPYVLMPQ